MKSESNKEKLYNGTKNKGKVFNFISWFLLIIVVLYAFGTIHVINEGWFVSDPAIDVFVQTFPTPPNWALFGTIGYLLGPTLMSAFPFIMAFFAYQRSAKKRGIDTMYGAVIIWIVNIVLCFLPSFL